MGNTQEKLTSGQTTSNAQEKPTDGGPSSTASDNQKVEVKNASDNQKTETQSPVQTYGDGKSKWCMVYAKALDITWSGDTRYWRWFKETSGDNFEAAELLNVCWLEVRGKLATTVLSPGTLYEVVFVVKMKTKAYGWDAPVNLKFTPPDGAVPRETKFKLTDLKDSKDQWKDIPFGEFIAPANPGNIEFSLNEYGGRWKSGLVIKGVAVRPKS
ncbi:protein PHLOEM PROTEIN 2-LIKE A1 [Prunus yedoensis var. nudiflora]|uniref:Protein PHLOEM PROTEIN 2-LIKE A1 n=1 Tax=Prunus yedoensis var. nudiflora TaxID=2094558 RepID=A0A314YHA8_PRUYE|nr:protein PHLOEM PROTEIN 2-LIKE A1 [Prunus yedoensis var. nudiflora]